MVKNLVFLVSFLIFTTFSYAEEAIQPVPAKPESKKCRCVPCPKDKVCIQVIMPPCKPGELKICSNSDESEDAEIN